MQKTESGCGILLANVFAVLLLASNFGPSFGALLFPDKLA